MPSTLYQASTGQAHANGPMAGDADKRPTPILEISDPTKPSGLVMTQIRSGGSHVMYHPVFKAYTDDAFNKPVFRDDTFKEPTGKDIIEEDKAHPKYDEKALVGLTTAVFRENLLPGSTSTNYKVIDLLRGFVGVCVSNTQTAPASGTRSVKRRKREEPRMTLAVAGTITMPYFKGSAVDSSADGSIIQPGDLVAFAMFFSPKYTNGGDNWCPAQRKDIRVLAGTEGLDHPEYVPRIRKFVDGHVYSYDSGLFKNSCTAPFGVCVGIDEEAEQITVLLRMDLYHSFYYKLMQDDGTPATP